MDDFRRLTVSSLLHIGTESAFHGAPTAGVAPLTIAVERATDLGDHARARWLLGVCLSSLGRFSEAREALDPLISEPRTLDSWAVLAHTTIASTLRQERRHVEAQKHDEQALLIADHVTIFDAHIGLAADAVGQLDVRTAREFWARAMAVARPEWRQQVRLAWVEVEILLMRKRAAQALKVAQAATETAEIAEAPRHQAKSLLFAGVAARELGDQELAQALLGQSLAISEELELIPLLTPARELLATITSHPN